MYRIFFFLIVTFLCLETKKANAQKNAENINKYYYLQLGKYFFDNNDYQNAWHLYMKVQETDADIFLYDDYVNISKCAYHLGKYKKCDYYLSKSISKGLEIENIKDDSLLNFYTTNKKNKSIINYQQLREQYQAKLNIKVCSKITYLFNLDQMLREQDDDTRFAFIDQDCKDKFFIGIDSSYIYDEIFALISSKEFLHQNIGRFNEELVVLLRHQSYYEYNFHQIEPILKKIVLFKTIQTEHLAFILDGYYLRKNNDKQVYGTQFVKYKPQIIFQEFININEVDEKRLECGLIPLNLKYPKNRCQLPQGYKPQFDINSFIKHINNNNSNGANNIFR